MHVLFHQLLTLLIVLPTAGALFMVLTGDRFAPRRVALVTMLLTLMLSLATLMLFDRHPATRASDTYAVRNVVHLGGVVQLVHRSGEVAGSPVRYEVGVDGLSLPLVLLTSFLGVIVCIASWTHPAPATGYFARLLVLQSAALGAFLVLDLFLFFLFFVLCLIAMSLFLNSPGGGRKAVASVRFVVLWLLGAIALLVVVVGVYRAAGSLDLLALPILCRDSFPQGDPLFHSGRILFGLLMFAFLIGLSAFPLHAAMSGATASASTPVSMILSSLPPVLAGYGLFRVGYPLFGQAAREMWLAAAVVGIVTILYGVLCAMAQEDLKKRIGFLGMSHLGFVVLGASVMTPAGVHGAMFLLVASAIIFATLHLIAGLLAQRVGHYDLSRLGGLAAAMPGLFGFAAVALMASAALPALCGFVGPFLVLAGVFQATALPGGLVAAGHARPGQLYALAMIGCLGTVLLGACVMFTLHRIFFGPRQDENLDLPDVTQRELAMLIPLTAMIFLLGLLPGVLFFDVTRTTVNTIYRFDSRTKPPATMPGPQTAPTTVNSISGELSVVP